MLGLLALAGMPCGFGHGLGWSHAEATAHIVEFRYSNGEPLAYASVLVRGPDQAVHQQGHADRLGRFAFAPDRPGHWRVEADDGMGHRLQAEIVISDKVPTTVTSLHDRNAGGPLGLSRPLAVLAGLSLLGNLAGGYYLCRRKRAVERPAAR